MVYAFSAALINASKENTWLKLVEAVKHLNNFTTLIDECRIDIEGSEEFLRTSHHLDIGHLTERISINPDAGKIIANITEHNLYYGQTVYQLIYPDDNTLLGRRIGLAVMMIWRLHPGVIEASKIDKDKLIEDLVNNIKHGAEWQTSH